MGLSVSNQVNSEKYFSLSTIDPRRIEEHGLNMTVEQLRQKAKMTPYSFEIYTGSSHNLAYQRRVKIWAYESFREGSA